MSRTATGVELLQQAQNAVKQAKTIEDLRIAQAVLLPLEFGLSIKQTGLALGRSATWVSRSRCEFIKQSQRDDPPEKCVEKNGYGGRRNQILALEDELPFMEFVAKKNAEIHRAWRSQLWQSGYTEDDIRMQFWQRVQKELQQRAKRPVSRATAYNLIKRTTLLRFQDGKPWRWAVYSNNLI